MLTNISSNVCLPKKNQVIALLESGEIWLVMEAYLSFSVMLHPIFHSALFRTKHVRVAVVTYIVATVSANSIFIRSVWCGEVVITSF